MMVKAILFFIVLLNDTWLVRAVVNCSVTGAGRHADLADRRCKDYTLCIYVRATDSYLAYDSSCPGKSLFNPKISRCTAAENFECSGFIKPLENTVCTSDGFIADLELKSCNTYIQCVEINGVFTQLRHNCPENTYFNPNTTLCEPDYDCTLFICKSPGRFADRYDFTCQRYFYCVKLLNGSYAQFTYLCPSSSVFNPITKLCSTQIRCS